MPRGARHVETGILRPGRWGYALETDGGGMWQLDIAGSARANKSSGYTPKGSTGVMVRTLLNYVAK